MTTSLGSYVVLCEMPHMDANVAILLIYTHYQWARYRIFFPIFFFFPFFTLLVPHSLLLAWRRYLRHHVLSEARNIAAPVLAFLLEPVSRLLDVATLTLWWGEECAATRESAGYPPLAEVWHLALWAMWKAQRFNLALAVVAIHLVDDLSNAKQETRTRSPTLELGGQ